MAGMKFSSVADLTAFIEKAVEGCMAADGEIADFVKEGLAEHASTDVYEAFSPTSYVRRGTLSDADEIETESSGMKLMITPTASFNENGNIEGNSGNQLAGLVNYGSGWGGYYYGWDHKPPARPYIDNTFEELQGGVFKALLADALQKSGFNVK